MGIIIKNRAILKNGPKIHLFFSSQIRLNSERERSLDMRLVLPVNFFRILFIRSQAAIVAIVAQSSVQVSCFVVMVKTVVALRRHRISA